MEKLSFDRKTARPAPGTKRMTIIGVVASGNLEVLLERVLPDTNCAVEIVTPVTGFGNIWEAVVSDFVERSSPGGLRICINDGGARPDTVALRLAQGVKLME